MSITNTADAIKVIEAMSADRCTDTCWCNRGGHDKPARAMRWTPDCEVARFPLSEEAA